MSLSLRLALGRGCREVVAPEAHEPLVERGGGRRSVLEPGAGLGLEGVLLEAPCLLPLLIRGLGLAVCPSQGRELPLDGHVVWQCVPCGGTFPVVAHISHAAHLTVSPLLSVADPIQTSLVYGRLAGRPEQELGRVQPGAVFDARTRTKAAKQRERDQLQTAPPQKEKKKAKGSKKTGATRKSTTRPRS